MIVPAFELRAINEDNTETLWLVFYPHLMEFRNRSGRYLKATKNLVETFFVIEQEYLFGENDEVVIQNEEQIDPNEASAADDQSPMELADDNSNDSDDSDELPIKIIDELYQQLREVHHENGPVNNHPDEYIQHEDLRPRLTNYQIDGVKWMLNRERITDYFPTEFEEVFLRWPDLVSKVKFFYNDRTMLLLFNQNEDIPIPTGGILADAMGLGKTVEMLCLILLNRRTVLENHHFERQTREIESYDVECYGDDSEFEDDDDYNYEETLRCLCPKKGLHETVRCIRCHMWQHRSCVSQRNTLAAPDTHYICPTCWQNEEPLEAKTTFIVSPPSIKLQWRDEVIKHIGDDNFKVSRFFAFFFSFLGIQSLLCYKYGAHLMLHRVPHQAIH